MKLLVNKSLVMTLKANDITLYMVDDIILNFLKTECNNELPVSTSIEIKGQKTVLVEWPDWEVPKILGERFLIVFMRQIFAKPFNFLIGG